MVHKRNRKDLKKRRLYSLNELQRVQLLAITNDLKATGEMRAHAFFELQGLPRNSCSSRVRNRCVETGRGRGNLRFCKLSRIEIRNLCSAGSLTGVRKSSW